MAVAGNVGTALSSLVGRLPDDATVVCEVSSFQLEDAVEFAPEGAVLLNLAPDHLDRHGTFEAYSAAKLRVFAHQGNDDVAVAPLGLGIEDLGGCARRVCFGDGPQAELSDRAGQLWWDDEPLIARRGDRACAACTTAATRWRRRRSAWRAGSSPTPCARPCGPSPGSSTASRRSRRIDGVALRQRLQGDQRRLDARGARELRHADPPDPRRPGQGRGLRAAARARGRALRRRLPHRRGGRAPGAVVGGRALRDARARARRGGRRPRGPARSCCSRPPARRSTSSTDYEARGRAFKELVAARRT